MGRISRDTVKNGEFLHFAALMQLLRCNLQVSECSLAVCIEHALLKKIMDRVSGWICWSDFEKHIGKNWNIMAVCIFSKQPSLLLPAEVPEHFLSGPDFANFDLSRVPTHTHLHTRMLCCNLPRRMNLQYCLKWIQRWKFGINNFTPQKI